MVHTFTLFSKFPRELRDGIWEEASRIPRNVTFEIKYSNDRDLYTPISGIPYTARNLTRPPAILHVNQESRRIGLKTFKLIAHCIFGTHTGITMSLPSKCFVSINDVYHVRLRPCTARYPLCGPVLKFLEVFELSVEQVQRLTLLETSSHTNTHEEAALCVIYLSSLKSLKLVFVTEDIAVEGRYGTIGTLGNNTIAAAMDELDKWWKRWWKEYETGVVAEMPMMFHGVENQPQPKFAEAKERLKHFKCIAIHQEDYYTGRFPLRQLAALDALGQ